MTLFFYSGAGDFGNTAVRLGTGFSLTQCAEVGVVGSSRVGVDDPSGALDIVGLKTFRVVETACVSWPRMFTGYMADRSLARADSLLTGAARRWDATVLDLNAALNFEVIRGSSADRPEETDIARLTWWLASGFAGPVRDAGFIDSAGPVTMEATDYRGRFGADLMNDLSGMSGKNHFVAWDDTTQQAAIHYYAAASTLNTCALRLSNVLADVDGSTVFAPSKDAQLFRDPSRVYSGVYMQFGTGEASVYVSNSGTASAFAPRDTAISDPTVTSTAKATVKANQFLNDAASEFDKITCSLHKLPAASANLIRAGQRVQVKFSHLPGYTSYVYIRISRTTVTQDGETPDLYRVDLELSNTKTAPGSGGGPGRPPTPDPDGETGLVASGSTLTLTRKEASRSTYRGGPAFAYGVVASPRTQSTISPNTPYTTAGCPIGAGGWGPGTSDSAIFWEFTPTLTATHVGALVTVEVPSELLGVAATGYAYAVVAYAAPTRWGTWAPVAYFQLSVGATLYLPRGLLRTGVVNYFGVAPGWQANRAQFFCAQDLVDGAGGPVVGGEGNSGRTNAYQVTITLATLAGVGLGVWVAGIGLVDGSNRSFSLLGWTGEGAVQLMINGVRQPDDAYVLSSSALTATMEAPPLEGDVVLWRYRVAL